MKALLEYIAKSLVDCPDDVFVTEEEGTNSLVLQLHVSESDMGKVIGKQGKIAKAMRTIVRSATPANSKKYVVEIRERGEDTAE